LGEKVTMLQNTIILTIKYEFDPIYFSGEYVKNEYLGLYYKEEE
jgi:hypothetical protein